MLAPRVFGGQSLSAAPSRQIFPLARGHTPTSARASDDLPEPLGPMMPSAVPAEMAKLASATAGEDAPGGETLAFSTERLVEGLGKESCRDCVGNSSSTWLSRLAPCRAA